MIRYKRNKDNISSKIQDEIVMVNVTHGNYYSLNPVAASIWEIIAAPHSIDAICDQLISEYDIDRETCEKQVNQFISDLKKMKLVDEIES